MAEPNEYDLQREERIRRNKAMLAKLEVCTYHLQLCWSHSLWLLQDSKLSRSATCKSFIYSWTHRFTKRQKMLQHLYWQHSSRRRQLRKPSARSMLQQVQHDSPNVQVQKEHVLSCSSRRKTLPRAATVISQIHQLARAVRVLVTLHQSLLSASKTENGVHKKQILIQQVRHGNSHSKLLLQQLFYFEYQLSQVCQVCSCVQMWQASHHLTLMQKSLTGQMTGTSCQVRCRWQLSRALGKHCNMPWQA